MPLKPSIVASLFLLAFTVMGCESTDSTDVKTTGIYADIHVSSVTTSVSRVVVNLLVGGSLSNTYLSLSDGDQLSATLNNSETRTLSRSKDILGAVTYSTTFSTVAATTANSTFKIALSRPADKSAPNSDVTVPAEVANFALDKTTASRTGDAMTVTWASANAAKGMDLRVDGACITAWSSSFPDSGLYVIPAGSITEGKLDPGQSTQCELEFTLSRSNNGTVDAAYGKGGSITAASSRTLKATSTR